MKNLLNFFPCTQFLIIQPSGNWNNMVRPIGGKNNIWTKRLSYLETETPLGLFISLWLFFYNFPGSSSFIRLFLSPWVCCELWSYFTPVQGTIFWMMIFQASVANLKSADELCKFYKLLEACQGRSKTDRFFSFTDQNVRYCKDIIACSRVVTRCNQIHKKIPCKN